MQKKYFFFDLDGTISIGWERVVPESTRLCLQKLQQNGHFVAVATGRLQKDAADFLAPLGIQTIVADGGNSLTIDGKLQEMRPLPMMSCRHFLRSLDSHNIPWAVTVTNEPLRITRDERFAQAVTDNYFPLIRDKHFNSNQHKTFYKIFLPYLPDQESDIDSFGLTLIRYTHEALLVEPVDKGNGIKKMMQRISKNFPDDLKSVVVFGDGNNDLGMFLPEWFSIAMGNARAELKEKASYVTSSCDEDGIFKACTHFQWI